jgi:hypothetical protein
MKPNIPRQWHLRLNLWARRFHYLILEQIVAVGTAVIYCAHDEQLGRDAAVKFLPAGTLAMPKAGRSALVTWRHGESVENTCWRAGVHLPRPMLAVFRPARPSSNPKRTHNKVDA